MCTYCTEYGPHPIFEYHLLIFVCMSLDWKFCLQWSHSLMSRIVKHRCDIFANEATLEFRILLIKGIYIFIKVGRLIRMSSKSVKSLLIKLLIEDDFLGEKQLLIFSFIFKIHWMFFSSSIIITTLKIETNKPNTLIIQCRWKTSWPEISHALVLLYSFGLLFQHITYHHHNFWFQIMSSWKYTMLSSVVCCSTLESYMSNTYNQAQECFISWLAILA